MKLESELQCDVLIVGSGIAGLQAADAASEKGARVILISQGELFSGASFYPGTWGFGLIAPDGENDKKDLAESIQIVGEGMRIHKMYSSNAEIQDRVFELLDQVGLNREHASRYVHEFSGGQRQRIGIARALALDPEFILCDEPISALDVSIQAQIINLLIRLQQERGLTYLFIAHDLSMVKHISDRVGVMYLGTMVEMTTSEELYTNPAHPYTKALLSAIPIPDPKVEHERQRIMLSGDVPSPINPAPGCRSKGRCPYASAKCSQETPVLHEIAPKHYVACHLY